MQVVVDLANSKEYLCLARATFMTKQEQKLARHEHCSACGLPELSALSFAAMCAHALQGLWNSSSEASGVKIVPHGGEHQVPEHRACGNLMLVTSRSG